MNDLVLDTTTHDLLIVNKDLSLFSLEQNLTVQKVKVNLLVYKGEWFRDVDYGVPYLQDILGKRNTKSAADIAIKSTITNTSGIQNITSYTSVVTVDRKLQVLFSAVTISGEILTDISVEV